MGDVAKCLANGHFGEVEVVAEVVDLEGYDQEAGQEVKERQADDEEVLRAHPQARVVNEADEEIADASEEAEKSQVDHDRDQLNGNDPVDLIANLVDRAVGVVSVVLRRHFVELDRKGVFSLII